MRFGPFVVALGWCVSMGRSQEKVARNRDTGYLGSCPLGILDLTFSSTSTDALKVLLVEKSFYNSYNVSKAQSLPKDKNFRKDFRTVIYISGFNDKPDSFSAKRIVEAYQTRGRYNIILVDASGYSSLEYLRSARSIRYAGIRLGNLVVRWAKSGDFDVRQLELVGHGLGAHVVGQMGKTYAKVTGAKLARIAALDPSGVCFRSAPPEDRIDKGDAEFVQVLHTNGGELGLLAPVGHADFYANGGRRQPAAPSFGSFCRLACSHDRAVEYWRYAVLAPDKFSATPCRAGLKAVEEGKCGGKGDPKTRVVMGPAADPVKARGVYYLPTTGVEPYYVDGDVHGTLPDYDHVYYRDYYHYGYRYGFGYHKC